MAIARAQGWWSGTRSDDTVSDIHRPLYLLDIPWDSYDWPRHLAVARAEHPALAAVPDILTLAQYPTMLEQAEELAPYCAALLIIPKVDAGLLSQSLLPRAIGGRQVILGYSVPTKYGASPLPLWSYAGWPVHLLGGTPRRQIEAAQYMRVVSADGNMAQKLANRGLVFDGEGHGVPMDRFEPERLGPGLPHRALALSLRHITALWQRSGATLEWMPVAV